MISIYEAVKIIRRETFPLAAETIDLEKSINRVLAEEVCADMDLPSFDRSQMDGFAVRTKDVDAASEEIPTKLKIIGESIAGKGFDGKIKEGEAVRVMTGARVPTGADAVQKKESAREFQNARGESFVEILEAVKLRQSIVRQAEEIKNGAKVFGAGEIINAQTIAPLASFGYAKVKVSKRPRAAILATGSEIVGVDEKPGRDQIRNSNSVMLKALAEKAGAQVETLPIVKDDVSSLVRQIFQATATCDVLIISGGVSVGDYDFTKPALRQLGAEIFFEKVRVKPGKPTVFATLNGNLIFGLPGNPVSSAVTFYLFVRAALLQMQGAKNCELKPGFAVLQSAVKGAKERDSFLPTQIETNVKGQTVAHSPKYGGSSDFIGFSKADALIFVPQNLSLKSGDVVKFVRLPD